MDELRDEGICSVLELLKIIFHFQSPSVELKNFVEKAPLKGQPLNETTVSLMLYYLLSIISIEKTKEYLMPSWPISSHKTRAQFRVGIKRFFTWIKVEWPDSQLKYSQWLLLNPYDTHFFPFFVKLAIFTIKLLAKRNKLKINFPESDKNESLEQLQNNLADRMKSFHETRKNMNAEYESTMQTGRKLDKENLILNDILIKQETLLKDLINTCPCKYQERLLSDDWKTVVSDLEEYKQLSEANENKIKTLEEIASLYSNLSDCFTSGSTELDSKELLKFGIMDMFDPNTKENQIPLEQILKVFKDDSKKYLHLLENIPQKFENKNELESIISDLEILCSFYKDYHQQLIDRKNKAIIKSNQLDALLKERNSEPPPRKLSTFFDSPVLTFPDEVYNEDSPFSSPGMTGEQMLAETKKYFTLKENSSVNDEIPLENRTTPVSRKFSKIPRLISTEPLHSLNNLQGWSDDQIMAPPVNYAHHHNQHQVTASNGGSNQKLKPIDLSTTPLAISLLQKQTWKVTNSKDSYQKPAVFSSTLCSNISQKEENLVEEHLSPILNTRQLADITDIDFMDISSSSPSGDEDSEDHRFHTPNTSNLQEKPKPRASLEAILNRYYLFRKRMKPEDK